MSLQRVSLKYTMWQNFRDQKSLKKLKLVHIQVEKIKVGTSCT